ncbi:PhnD/SsuA/transferrin family substrate-binding protein [Candidatus Thiodiazotropha sp. CDECU1]|uniref:PhnD/SsuA/transferrin family substrate-binding protein n=1 Tax=Candidatus Thiodiazotropha sp. CDECU1 TaxID=3065865 RepID=UPI00292CB222|nr:PhnD/SsuA/transferrin family substrate-binding protein [Candidatus Thiodiazotropha sp. CDECU1]
MFKLLNNPTRQFISILILWFATTLALADTPLVKIGVLAKRGPEKSLERWNATAEYLNDTLPAYRFKIIPMAFDDIQILVKNQMVDFVIVNPGIYVNLSVKYGVRRVLTLINKLSHESQVSNFGSVIFTLRERSSIQNLGDLRDQRVAAVHSTSLGGWIMARRELRVEAIEKWDFASLLFLNTHDAVVNAVLRREAEVGIVRTDTLERMTQEGKLNQAELRIIAPKSYEDFPYAVSTPLYPEWPFSQLPHTSQMIAREVAVALLELPPDHAAARDARIHGWTIPENYQTVHDLLALLEMPPYDKNLKDELYKSITEIWYWYLLILVILLVLGILFMRLIRLNRSLTAHKKSLEESEQAQIVTFEQAPVGLAHISLNGNIVRLNHRLSEIVALSPKQIIDINLKDLLFSDDIPICTSAFDKLRNREMGSVSSQLRLVCANGATKWIQLSLSTTPKHRNNDYLIAVIDDIDHYKTIEEESLHIRQQKELILDIADDGIIGIDSHANHTFVNPAAADMLGYTIDELLDRNSHTVWHHSREDGSDYPISECPITRVLQHGKKHRGEHETIWRKDGKSIQVDYVSTPIKDGERIIGAVVIFHRNTISIPDKPTASVT